jgi:hypothetical protein
MPIRITSDSIQLEVVHSVYKERVEYERLPEGESYPVKKEVLQKQIRVKKWFKKEAITSVEEYVTVKNTIAKNRSIVFDKYSGKFYATFHHPEEVIKNIEPQSYKNQIGFTHDTKIYPAGSQIHKYKERR